MKLVIDTSVIIAVLVNEPTKKKLIKLTKGAELIAPHSVHWEIGHVTKAIQAYQTIDIKFIDIELDEALVIADKAKIYAYDAYLILCALKKHCPLISLDNGLVDVAKNFGVETVEI